MSIDTDEIERYRARAREPWPPPLTDDQRYYAMMLRGPCPRCGDVFVERVTEPHPNSLHLSLSCVGCGFDF